MKPVNSVAVATWLLEHLTFGQAREAVSGDLLEEFHHGRPVRWFWRQVLSAIAIGACRAVRERVLPLVFAVMWSTLYPAWRLLYRGGLAHTAAHRWSDIAWPWSAMLELGNGMAPAVTFVWVGFLVYLLLRGDLVYQLSRESPVHRLIRVLSGSLTVLLIATVWTLEHLKHHNVDLTWVTRGDFYSVFHLSVAGVVISVPLALGLLVMLLSTISGPPRIGRRRRSVHRWNVERAARVGQALCLMLCLGLPLFAQTKQAESAVRQKFDQWLAVFDGNDFKAYAAFLEKNYQEGAGRADQDWRVRQNTGGFDLKKVSEETPVKITVLMQERNSDMFGQLTLEVDAAEPHRIVKMEMRPVGHPPEFAIEHLSEAELISALRKQLDEKAAQGTFSGAVLVAKDGKPVLEQAYGLADRENHIPNTLKTRFRNGSMNKMFTAVATLQLVQAGKLKLDDPLGKYLTDYPNKEVATKVTIGELLTHTGGTGDFFGPEFDQHRLELRTHADYVKLFGNRPPRFEPGSRFEYSNYGFLLLGNIIERVTGESYYDYVREHVYEPAGMALTGSEPEDVKVADRSVGYTRMGTGEWHPNTETLPHRGTSAGGGYTTVGDLLAFANALKANKLLDAHYTELLTTGKVDMPGPGGARYAYGFEVMTMNGLKCVGHGGGAPGMNGELEMCGDYTVIALANIDPPAAMRVVEWATFRLPEVKAASVTATRPRPVTLSQ
jgi:D-alanyl-D-alanine carboxypeptidase